MRYNGGGQWEQRGGKPSVTGVFPLQTILCRPGTLEERVYADS